MQHNICMVCDFFYPNVGGVESHIYQLSQCLMNRGHKVVIVTHAYNDQTGVRYMANGLKVYYLPLYVIYNQCTLPTLFTTFPVMRHILTREQINIVHGHSAFSALAHESIIHARMLGIKTVFTDHSLFGFTDASAIITNILLSMTLSLCNRVICVSHTGKENTALRANVKPETIYVIPNAVDNDIFVPDFNKIPNRSKVTIVVISRLVYRKGIDLLSKLIPIICERYSNIEFIIGGDGPKRAMLNDVVKQNKLENRVQLLGAVKSDQVRSILIKGDIFLNSSLTEAFCIAIVEAVSCGLQVVTTNVGGIPEVLPSDLIWLGEPTVNGLVGALEKAIKDRELGNIVCPLEAHNRIRNYYRWPDIARRTELVYDSLIDHQSSSTEKTSPSNESAYEIDRTNNLSCWYHQDRIKISNAGDEKNLNRENININYDEFVYQPSRTTKVPHSNCVIKVSKSREADLIDNQTIDQFNCTAKKVLYKNEKQYIDLEYLRSNQDRRGLKQLIRQCLKNSGWFFGLFLLFLLYIEYLIKLYCDWWTPQSQIDICPSTHRQTKIRKSIVACDNSIMKVSKHKYTRSCINCDLYVVDDQAMDLVKCRQLRQLFRSTNHSLLTKYINSLNSTNAIASKNNGLKTIELINQLIDQQYYSYQVTAAQSTVISRSVDDESDNKDESNKEPNEELNYELNERMSVRSIYSLKDSTDDDPLEDQQSYDDEDKNSTTESTSGYNSSNSVDLDSNFDNNSTGFDLGEHMSSANYLLDCRQIDKLDPSHLSKQPADSISLTSLLVRSEAKEDDTYSEFHDSSTESSSSSFGTQTFDIYRCNNGGGEVRPAILIKN